MKNDNHYKIYHDAYYILFHTGLRISEFTGHTISDIDFDKGYINISRQLTRRYKKTNGETKGQCVYYVSSVKTASGDRGIPMEPEVRECFKRIIDSRPTPKKEPVVPWDPDDRESAYLGTSYEGFLFLDKNEMPVVAQHWEKHLQLFIEKYNRKHEDKIKKITPHGCRHTYCTNLIRKNYDLPSVQYIMGHADFDTTMNTYTHIQKEDVKEKVINQANPELKLLTDITTLCQSNPELYEALKILLTSDALRPKDQVTA